MASSLKLTTPLFRQAVFYAATIVLGMAVALSELDQGHYGNFLRYSCIGVLVMVVELYLGWTEHTRKQYQSPIPHIDQLSKYSKFLHHFVLPLVTYLSLVGFTYFNRQTHLRALILIGTTFLFTILFINIRAYYTHTVKVIESTHFIYDIIKLIIFFCACDAIFNMSMNFGLGVWGGVGVASISIGLMLLMIVRYNKLELLSFALVIMLSIAVGSLAVFLLVQDRFNAVQLSLMTFLTFYISSAALHHEMDHDLTWEIIVEYIAILVIAMTLLYGIAG
jgi:hypothetical protein